MYFLTGSSLDGVETSTNMLFFLCFYSTSASLSYASTSAPSLSAAFFFSPIVILQGSTVGWLASIGCKINQSHHQTMTHSKLLNHDGQAWWCGRDSGMPCRYEQKSENSAKFQNNNKPWTTYRNVHRNKANNMYQTQLIRP